MVLLFSIAVYFAKLCDSYIWRPKLVEAAVSEMEIKKLS